MEVAMRVGMTVQGVGMGWAWGGHGGGVASKSAVFELKSPLFELFYELISYWA